MFSKKPQLLVSLIFSIFLISILFISALSFLFSPCSGLQHPVLTVPPHNRAVPMFPPVHFFITVCPPPFCSIPLFIQPRFSPLLLTLFLNSFLASWSSAESFSTQHIDYMTTFLENNVTLSGTAALEPQGVME